MCNNFQAFVGRRRLGYVYVFAEMKLSTEGKMVTVIALPRFRIVARRGWSSSSGRPIPATQRSHVYAFECPLTRYMKKSSSCKLNWGDIPTYAGA